MIEKKEEKIEESYHAKIMLFGEYSILFGSMAFSVPFAGFKAGFSFCKKDGKRDSSASDSNSLLKSYADWMEKSGSPGLLRELIDIDAFREETGNGLFFKSTIPQGYGIGSSGALCAAVYERYALNRISGDPVPAEADLKMLKEIFAAMESRFHGKSSGLDPLTCYFRHPLLSVPGEGIKFARRSFYNPGRMGEIFLLDTGAPGKTGLMMDIFLRKRMNAKFNDLLNSVLLPSVNGCISSLINHEPSVFRQYLKRLSDFQLRNLEQMVPRDFHPLWEKGLKTDDYYLKLCGSGGGGFLLVFTTNAEKVKGLPLIPFSL